MGKYEEKKELYEATKEKILAVSFELIKEYGLVHTSVEKIATAVGIGKGTFYQYFPSKEMMVYELLKKQEQCSLEDFQRRLDGREKMSMEEGKEYLKFMAAREYVLYPYLTPKDMEKLEEILGANRYEEISIEDQYAGIRAFLSHVENVRDNIDLKLLTCLFKVTSVAFRHWEQRSNLPPKQMAQEVVFEHLYSLIFKE